MTMQSINLAPYYQHNNCTLYQGDILNSEHFQGDSFDLIITSPPYNVGIEYNSSEDSNSYESYLEFSKKWIENCYL
ncbi:truncated adenine specific DNA methyltransferase [Helicobacter muridarum]|uniref:site-specific DNA-methyltransferase (cytosine-N(4)-specific) n=1 Tax=Helicobacter muridarum TaxID=216 RepID=A0A377PTJ7_9HELI|nr:truncated adenine specific DNA methyltransferase [Helicobacter muridarum]